MCGWSRGGGRDGATAERFRAGRAAQEAHTDVWERRWAGDKVTNARGDRLRGLRDLRLRIKIIAGQLRNALCRVAEVRTRRD